MKIVSLLPSATEIVYSLGLEDSLHGVTFECDFPGEARAKPIISNTSLPLEPGLSAAEIDRLVAAKVAAGEPLYVLDEQRIQELQPDLILAQDLCRVCAVPSGQVTDALDKLGCRADVISLDPSSIDDVLAGIEQVASAARAEDRGRRLVGGLRERIERVRSTAACLPAVPTVAIEWPDPIFVGGHWVPEMIRVAGGRDGLGVEGEPSRRVSWSEISAAAPEVVIYMPCGFFLDDAVHQARRLYEMPHFAGLPAARTGMVFATDASSYFSRPGPRIVDGIEILAWALHPEAFREPPPARVVRVSPP